MRVHIEREHASVFEHLVNLDKKITGLSDHQNSLLRLFYLGKSDSEIQGELGIGSSSTIRNHRFVLREKERQAKVFLVLMELLKESNKKAPRLISPHRIKGHEWETLHVENGGHPNRQLQEEWNKYGEEAFVFEVLEILEEKETGFFDKAEELKKLEKKWLGKLQPYAERGYNKENFPRAHKKNQANAIHLPDPTKIIY